MKVSKHLQRHFAWLSKTTNTVNNLNIIKKSVKVKVTFMKDK